MILSCPVMIILMEGGPDQLYWQAFKKRQQVVANYEACRRTARQLAYEVAALKAKKEADTGDLLSVKELSDMFAPAPERHGRRKQTDRHGRWLCEGLHLCVRENAI